MLVVALLRRLVVVRPDGEHAVGAQFLRALAGLDGLSRRVAAGPCDHGHAAVGLFDDELHDPIGFIRV